MSVADIRRRYRGLVIPDLFTVHSKILDQAIKDVHELLVEVAWQETPMRVRHKALLAAAEAMLSEEPGSLLDLADAIAACKREGPK